MAAQRIPEEAKYGLAYAVMCINKCKLLGLVDSDVSTSPTTLTTLIANIVTARDRVAVHEADKLPFNYLIGWLIWAAGYDIIDGTIITNLLTVSGTSAATDLRYNFTNHADYPTAVPVADHSVLVSPPSYKEAA